MNSLLRRAAAADQDGRQTGVSKEKRKVSGGRLPVLIMLFYLLAFLLSASRTGDRTGYILAAAVPVMILICTRLLPCFFPMDRLVMTLTAFLCALGLLLLYVTRPAYAVQQAIACGTGLVLMMLCTCFVRAMHTGRRIIWVIMPLSLLLLSLPLMLGKPVNGALNWVTFGSLSFQPSELVKLSLILVLSFFLSRRSMLPWLLYVLLCLLILLLQRDLGTALLYFCSALLLYWASSGNVPVSMLGLAAGAGAAFYGYQAFPHVRLRVSLWLNPLEGGAASGEQLLKGFAAISEGGLWGSGLGLGNPTSIPVYESDFMFAVLCEQFGMVFSICVLLMYAALIWRSMEIAVSARRSFHGLLSMGSVTMIGLQTFVIVGGVLRLIPLTGVPLPFISFGGTSLVSNLCLIGFVQGVACINRDNSEEEVRLSMLERG